MDEVQPPPGQLPGCALLLLGHGSDRSPAAARPVRALAGELERRGRFGPVHTGFWKEEPYLHQALWRLDARKVIVVPIFTSRGYYTDRVIPRELGLNDPARRPPGMAVQLCAPVGSHPGMLEVILDRARPGTESRETAIEWREALILVGHGTPRHPGSGGVTHELADALREHWPHGPVVPAFLDETPTVAEVIRELDLPRAVVVPFFIAEGWHAGVTLPGSLGVEGGVGHLGRTALRYASPVGTDPRLADFVEDLAWEGIRALRARQAPPVPGEGP